MAEEYRKMDESKHSQQLQEMKEAFETREFGIISAFKGDREFSENMMENQKLFHVLRGLGVTIYPIRGVWEGVSEYSYFVVGISNRDIFKLSFDFKQDAVLWGDNGHFWLMETQTEAQLAEGTEFHMVEPGENFQNYSETLDGEKFVLR